MIIPVDDPRDPRLAVFQALPGRTQEEIVIEGEIAVQRALGGRVDLAAVLATARVVERLRPVLGEELPVYVASAELMRQVVGFDFHRGCLAWARRPPLGELEALAPTVLSGRESVTVVVAEGLADPFNLGAVIRNCRALGATLLVCGRGADPWSRRAIRGSMGHGFVLPVVVAEDLVAAVAMLRGALGSGVWVTAAAVGPGAVPLGEHRTAQQRVLLVGNEGQGLSSALLETADERVTIPMAPGVDSLNVAAATAVMLWGLR